MPNLRELMRTVLEDGRIDGHEVEALCDLMYADEVIDRREAEFLIGLHRRVERPSPGFEKFVYATLKRHLLADGAIGPEEAGWLRRTIFADGRVTAGEKKLVRDSRARPRASAPSSTPCTRHA